MPWALAIGPAAALLGIGAIFFVLRRKSVDKRSMYSARRSQIEHKVRAARQRTLAPHGRAEKEDQAAPSAGAAPFGAQAPVATYEASAYEPPPAAAAPAVRGIPDAPSSSPWDVGTAIQPPGQFEAPPVGPPAFEPAFEAAPVEEVWTPSPAPTPAEPVTPIEPIRPAAAAASPTGWSVVGEAKESADTAEAEPKKKKKGKDREQEAVASGSWQLASGNTPGAEPDEGDAIMKPPGQAVAIAQYAVLVVGLVAVLIGVLIILASPSIK
ncbi:MAG TPA: hypothetical protein VNU27_11825 [Candidatus Acidoferrum sp.]|jgi:hypothetical protein|nr:hypothetical protein [Candidatus Acidoferrum sp.]